MKKSVLCILVLLVSISAFTQELVSFKGRVSSGDTSVPGATIALLKNSDSMLVKLSLTNKEGIFEFTGIPVGSYLYLVTSVGFDSLYLKATENETAEIVLTKSSQALGAVTITAKRPLVEARLDKMIVNVDASPSNAAATALELLEKSPGVSVD
ncbi:MAG: carboxypeptidase regulatory-like domain-containing protein, partial [Chitinophagaceae bacterium]